MFKTLVEYITEVEAVSNPEGTILSVIQLIKKTAEGSGDAAKFSMPRFLNHLKNAGLDIDYAGFKGYYDASPSIQNSIGQFTEKEISFGSDEDSESSETMGKPEGKMPPAEKVAQMANRAVKARESASDSLMDVENPVKEEVELDETVKIGDTVTVKLNRKGREYIEKGKVIKIEKDSIIVKHDFSRTPSRVSMKNIVKEEVELDEEDIIQKYRDEVSKLEAKKNKTSYEIGRLKKMKQRLKKIDEEVDLDESQNLKNMSHDEAIEYMMKHMRISRKHAERLYDASGKKYSLKDVGLEEVELDESVEINNPKSYKRLEQRLKELKDARRRGVEDRVLGRKVKGADIADVEIKMAKLRTVKVSDLTSKNTVKEEVKEGYYVMPPMDREKYQERDGLEGPFQTRSGKVVYYDPKEGSYYDPDSDIYLSYEEFMALDNSNSDDYMSPENVQKRIDQAQKRQGKSFFQNRNDRIAADGWKPVRTINKDKFFGKKERVEEKFDYWQSPDSLAKLAGVKKVK